MEQKLSSFMTNLGGEWIFICDLFMERSQVLVHNSYSSHFSWQSVALSIVAASTRSRRVMRVRAAAIIPSPNAQRLLT